LNGGGGGEQAAKVRATSASSIAARLECDIIGSRL
jgi:hypothetical protein